VGWRLIDLARSLLEDFQVSTSKQTLSRELNNIGFRDEFLLPATA
jgi:hypothetical protein